MIKRGFSTAHEWCENLDANLRMHTRNAMKAKGDSYLGSGRRTTEGGGRRKVMRGENEQRKIMYMREIIKNHYWLLTLMSC